MRVLRSTWYSRTAPDAGLRARVSARISESSGSQEVRGARVSFMDGEAPDPMAFQGYHPDLGSRPTYDRVLAEITVGAERHPLVAIEGARVCVRFPFFAWEDTLLTESTLPETRPFYSGLPLPYGVIPFGVRARMLWVRNALAERARPFPRWPIEALLDRLRRVIWTAAAELEGAVLAPIRGPGQRPLVVLTHDVDEGGIGVEGIAPVRAIERRAGVCSAFGILSKRYQAPRSVLTGLLDEGCEIFSHGYLHDGTIAYLDDAEIDRRLRHFFDVYPYLQEHVKGYRAEILTRNQRLFRIVARHFEYDMTPPTTEPYGPYGPSGCASVHPFVGTHGLMHIPLTIPQDYMIYPHAYGPSELLSVWRRTLHHAWSEGGVAVLGVHPDNVIRTPWLGDAYGEFLAELTQMRAEVITPYEALARLRT